MNSNLAIFTLLFFAGVAPAAEQVEIPSLSIGRGAILTGCELSPGEVREVTLELNEMAKVGAIKGASEKFSARVLCDAKLIANTNRINLTAKKIVYVFPSGYVAEILMVGYVVSKEDGSDALLCQKNYNIDDASLSAIASNQQSVYNQEIMKNIKPTILLQKGRIIDLVFTEKMEIEDKSKKN